MALVEEDKWDEALDLLESTNPLPGVTGRVCNSPCEGACNRGRFDQPLSIRVVERALADHAARRERGPGVRRRKRKERVAVVGAGPAGLSCAYHLARQGFPVTVFEQAPEIGGILRYGIPRYRLPAGVLDREVASIGKMGVDFKVNQRLDGNIKLRDLDKYDALFLATGLQAHRKPGIPGEECAGVTAGLNFLEKVSKGEPPEIGRRVLVVGGGNSAVDSARSALRLGARPTLVYRRRETDMPALASEIEDLKAEGIDIRHPDRARPVHQREPRSHGHGVHKDGSGRDRRRWADQACAGQGRHSSRFPLIRSSTAQARRGSPMGAGRIDHREGEDRG